MREAAAAKSGDIPGDKTELFDAINPMSLQKTQCHFKKRYVHEPIKVIYWVLPMACDKFMCIILMIIP